MARDILTFPVSTVPSESIFSQGRQIIDDSRYSLRSNALDVVVCLRDWIRAERRNQGIADQPEDDDIVKILLDGAPRPSDIETLVFKSGPLFISSKGLGWKSWKKRWFVLTRTSLVFFKNDSSTLPQRAGEVNLSLGGIDLNNSGRLLLFSVVVREDKKLLIVLFPDGRDGRAFTLKAETADDLCEWKTALEHALSQAPSAALVMGHDGIFRNGASDSFEGSFHQWKDKRPVKSLVVGRPILLALEDIDGGAPFLETALGFLEKYGKGFGGKDLDIGSPRDGCLPEVKLKSAVDSLAIAVCNLPLNELERHGIEINALCQLAGTESQRSMGEILSSTDVGPPLSVPVPGSCIDKTSSKLISSNQNVKRSTFLGEKQW